MCYNEGVSISCGHGGYTNEYLEKGAKMQYEAISTAGETLPRAMELMARELTNATGAGYYVLEESLTHHYDGAYGRCVLSVLIYKPERMSDSLAL